MKKKLMLLLMCSMVLGAGSAFAQTPAGTANPSSIKAAAPVKKLQVLKEFQDELHTLNGLRETRLETKDGIVHKQDQLVDLTLAAKENKDKEALIQAADIRKQIRATHQEIKGLYDSFRTEAKAFRQAVKDRDQAQAQTHIDSAIMILGQVNAKLATEASLYDQVIAIFS
ncbi:hypothetical protein [Cohnella candidum]|uniref:OmpH family outer membrane protein n=1 Tax=Cohnella candidum TaxID=2674991 RepID=A0A3G3K1Z6_9BACL|nr:hypothetical protein [Cohnella candidum]AYQ74554.1 hypothetical protein EAV92_19455 [Cohnella candidum]